MCCVLFFENSAKKITHVPCCAYVSKLCIKSCASIKQPDYPDHGPSLSGGGRQDKARRNTPKPSPKTQKRVLGQDRTARLPKPGPALSGGVGRTKRRWNTPKPAQETQKAPEPINKKNPDLGTHKNGKISGAAAVRKSAVHGFASRFVYVTLDPPCKRAN